MKQFINQGNDIVLNQLNVFLSSPGDVAAERAVTREVVSALAAEFAATGYQIKLIAWEDYSLGAWKSPQVLINNGVPRPSACAIVVAILGARLGTPLSREDFSKPDGGRYESGTEWEILDAIAGMDATGGEKPRKLLVYRKDVAGKTIVLGGARDNAFRASVDECRQWVRLNDFFDRTFWHLDGSIKRIFDWFETSEGYRSLVTSDLRRSINECIRYDVPYLCQRVIQLIQSGICDTRDIRREMIDISDPLFDEVRRHMVSSSQVNIVLDRWHIRAR